MSGQEGTDRLETLPAERPEARSSAAAGDTRGQKRTTRESVSGGEGRDNPEIILFLYSRRCLWGTPLSPVLPVPSPKIFASLVNHFSNTDGFNGS